MEREFRKLALEEAKGTISKACAKRLEELNRWRNQLLHAQTAEEILLQLKRDRLPARMESLLKQYAGLCVERRSPDQGAGAQGEVLDSAQTQADPGEARHR
jgi:hypothetical protein